MSTPHSSIAQPQSSGFPLQPLVDAIATAEREDAVVANLTAAQWKALAPYLQLHRVEAGQILFNEGALDRTLYLVESGSLSVHVQDSAGRLRLAMVGGGSVVGEAAFFSRLPRMATVQAAGACRLWALTPVRFTELSHRLPDVALALVLAVGGVLGKRLGNRRRRVAAT